MYSASQLQNMWIDNFEKEHAGFLADLGEKLKENDSGVYTIYADASPRQICRYLEYKGYNLSFRYVDLPTNDSFETAITIRWDKPEKKY